MLTTELRRTESISLSFIQHDIRIDHEGKIAQFTASGLHAKPSHKKLINGNCLGFLERIKEG